jgi:mono/diheme cytochrome c family protein
MRYFFLAYLLLIIVVVSFAGFRGGKTARSPIQLQGDMDAQAKITPQSSNDFFANRQGGRYRVPGTIPMGFEIPTVAASAGGKQSLTGFAIADNYLNTGKMGEFYGHGLPEEVTADTALLERGALKYSIYCSICHGASGNGAGVISKYGLAPANLVVTPINDPTQRPDGQIYDVIVNGKGLMGGYGANLTLQDRWAIVSYVRVLQQRSKMPAAEVKDAFDAWEADQKEEEEAEAASQPKAGA